MERLEMTRELCVKPQDLQSCKLQGHIKHEWEGYLGDVGQSHPFVTKPCGLGSPKRTNSLGVGLRCKAKNGEDPDTDRKSVV